MVRVIVVPFRKENNMWIQPRLRVALLSISGLSAIFMLIVWAGACRHQRPVSEDDLLRLYFGPYPAQSFLMRLHMNWHLDPLNNVRAAGSSNYGARFFAFHQTYIDMYDLFRSSRGLPPVQPWDPATPI